MIIQKINNQTYNNYNRNYNRNNVSFRSNREHEEMLRKLDEEYRKQAVERRKQEAIEKQKKMIQLNELHNYKIHDESCHSMAQFLLNFSCAIENDSEHDLGEFFKSDEEAAKLREKLSPECQKNSLELRKEIQSQPILKDPALTLITAKNMKEYVPVDEEFAANKEYQQTINSAKKTVVEVVEASDKSKFDKAEIGLMKELTQIIEKTKGLDFGEEYDKKLQTLVDSINDRKQKLEQTKVQKKNFIPKIKKILRIK